MCIRDRYDVEPRYADRFADVTNPTEKVPFQVVAFTSLETLKEGKESKNPMAFRYYDAEKVINGKKMKDWLKFAICLQTR